MIKCQGGDDDMRVIITGGTGLIGRSLAVDLSKDGHEIIVLRRNPPRSGESSLDIRHSQRVGSLL